MCCAVHVSVSSKCAVSSRSVSPVPIRDRDPTVTYQIPSPSISSHSTGYLLSSMKIRSPSLWTRRPISRACCTSGCQTSCTVVAVIVMTRGCDWTRLLHVSAVSVRAGLSAVVADQSSGLGPTLIACRVFCFHFSISPSCANTTTRLSRSQ